MKKVYFEPLWKIHPCHRHLILYPPEGYEFITNEGLVENTAKLVSRWGFSPQLMDEVYKVLPLNLIKSYLDGFFKKPPPGTDLTYSAWHIIFRKEPWVVELGSVTDPVGPYFKHVKRHKTLIENVFASEYCKGIICWSEHVRRLVVNNLDCTKFEDKIETILPAIPEKDFTKDYNNDKVKLIFVGSAALAGEFDAKGGKEVLEAFRLLTARHDNLELVIRSDIPKSIKGKYLGLKGLKLIEEVIPWEILDEEYKTADIFLMPAHYDPWATILEAMSYELPVITTDVYANPEWVENGRTGFIIRSSERLRHYHEDGITPLGQSSWVGKAAYVTDPDVVAELVEKTSILIEDKELRRRMGRAARWEIEHGKFSIERRNELLKRVFDKASS
jgi:glycosyltransferase involved in cell wall biosynthesis